MAAWWFASEGESAVQSVGKALIGGVQTGCRPELNKGQMDKRLILIAGMVTVAGAAGGFALADFTTSGLWPRGGAANGAADDFQVNKNDAPFEVSAPPAAPPPPPAPPERFICRGCGPTLMERQMQGYADSPVLPPDRPPDIAPLPPYEPLPGDVGMQEPADARPEPVRR